MLALLATAALAAEGTANIPVSELLELHAGQPDTPAPPIAGVLDALQLSGRVLDDALVLKIDATVSVLASEGWTTVPLLRVSPDLSLDALPSLSKAWLAIEGGSLILIARESGTHSFQLSATVQPSGGATRRDARLTIHPATTSSLVLQHDPELVRLIGATGAPSGDGARRIRPSHGTYAVSWEVLDTAPERPVASPRTIREPSVRTATTSVVSTLEGTWLSRTRYVLSFEGRRTVDLSWPEDQALQRVYVNGQPTTDQAEGSELSLEISPAQSGGDEGTIELVLVGERSGYLLQGTLDLQLPSISWPVQGWDCTTHLPEVFNYSWRGGSMQQTREPPEAPPFAYEVPTPGKATHWRQELVFSSSPSLRLDYTVDLEGRYFRPGAAALDPGRLSASEAY